MSSQFWYFSAFADSSMLNADSVNKEKDMARPLTVAAAQLGPSSPHKTQTVERMVTLMEEAGERGVELLSFPELSLTPYFATKVHASWDGFFEDEMPSP